uniref:Leucine-rich repeat-containing protein 37A3-like n=1 Tax=Tursiops truncatus TaxID=9739 RepID=A0A6J3QTJ7_TURTR|nr:leucine-rich repeat-containing protein 37A3-like [Tursiops truncatus]
MESSPVQQAFPRLPLEPLKETEPSPAEQETPSQSPAPPKEPEVTFPNAEQVQAQHPTLTEVTVQPLDLELTIRPQPTKEDETSPTMQDNLTQPPEPPKEVFVAQLPVYKNPVVPTPDQDHTERPASPSVTVQPLDQGLTTTPEPTMEAEHSTPLQETVVPPTYHEVTLPNPEQVQAQHPTLTEDTIQPLDLELTLTLESTLEVDPSPTMQQTQAQPPELIRKL